MQSSRPIGRQLQPAAISATITDSNQVALYKVLSTLCYTAPVPQSNTLWPNQTREIGWLLSFYYRPIDLNG